MTLIETLNRTFLSLLAVFTFVGVLLYSLLISIDPRVVKEITLKEIQETIDHPLDVKGRVNIRLWPIPTVKLNQVNLNLNTSSKVPIQIQAKTLILKLDIWPLLKTWSGPKSKKNILIDSFSMEKIQVHSKQLKQDYAIEQLSGQLKNNEISKINFKMHAHKSDLKGDFKFEPHLILGHINAHYLDTKELPLDLSDLSLLFSGGSTLKTHLNIQLDSLKTAYILLNKTKLTAKILQGKIILSPLSTEIAEGTLEGSVILENHKTQIHMHAKEVLLEKIMTDFFGYKNLVGGRAQMALFATGEGIELPHLLETLTGRALFVIKDAVLKNVRINTSVSQLLNPFAKKPKHTHVQCAILRLNLRNGMAYAINNLGIETPEFNIWGTGHLNLKTKEIEVELINKPKGGLKIEIGQFAKYSSIKGTLDHPRISFNPKGLIQESLSIIAGIATGGVSTIAEQLFKISENNTSACYSILNKKNEYITDER